MKFIENPSKNTWPELCLRPSFDRSVLDVKVSAIISQVEKEGDKALREFTQKFDGAKLEEFFVSTQEIKNASEQLSSNLKESILTAKKNIEKFHKAQISPELEVETSPGVLCSRKAVPIEKVGLYIPSGTAPLLSTALMLGIPAKIAGCSEIYFVTPPDKEGKVSPSILFVADMLGIDKIIKLGGAQAIAALGLGTKSISKVDKIFGPGNQFVNAAKLLMQNKGVAIDLPAGPSEVCVIADESSRSDFVAADLLSQAEHGKDSQVVLLSNSVDVINKVEQEVLKQLEKLPRKDIAKESLQNSLALKFSTLDECMSFSNLYAPEHLILAGNDTENLTNKVRNAGSVFIGNYSPESAGDYASGTNHTLPTSGTAASYSGVSLDSFYKKITFQKLTSEGLKNIAKAIETMAEAEGLSGHAEAVRVRVREIEGQE